MGPRQSQPTGEAKQPLLVTDRALAVLALRRARQRGRPDQAIGIVRMGIGGVGLVLDVPGADDRLFTWGGMPILFVEAALAARFADRVLDFGGEAGRERFTIGGRLQYAWDATLQIEGDEGDARHV